MIDQDDSEGDDGFGPATDLVLSLLGVIILLLAIGQYQQRLKVLIGIEKPPATADVMKPQPAPPDLNGRILDLSSRLAQSEAELEAARKFLSTVPLRIVALKLDGRNVSFFDRNSAELHPAMRQLIAGYIPTLARLVLANRTNEIEVTGFASPEPSGVAGKDANLDISAERSIAVAHYLAQLGVPYQCLSVSGFGRGRSEILYGSYMKRSPQNTVESWDNLMAGDKGRELRSRLEEQMSEERRVEIAVVVDRNSSCTTEELQKALGL